MNFSSEQPKIVVVGSCSLDLILYTDKIPSYNETVLANQSENYFGGKGANQAVGVARLGANTYFVGCVGMDPLGQQIMRNLVNENVNVGFVSETDRESTGTAYVTSDDFHDAIVVVPAANNCVTEQNVEEADKYIYNSHLVLLQLEIPMNVIEFTIKKAKKYGKLIGLYASPGKLLSDEMIEMVDFIIVKSSDLETVFGEDQKEKVLKKYFNKVFLRDETNSTVYYDGTEMKYFRNIDETMKYKIGMGDAFTSGFSIALCHGNSLEDCIHFGHDVSARVSKVRGAQNGLPKRSDFR